MTAPTPETVAYNLYCQEKGQAPKKAKFLIHFAKTHNIAGVKYTNVVKIMKNPPSLATIPTREQPLRIQAQPQPPQQPQPPHDAQYHGIEITDDGDDDRKANFQIQTGADHTQQNPCTATTSVPPTSSTAVDAYIRYCTEKQEKPTNLIQFRNFCKQCQTNEEFNSLSLSDIRKVLKNPPTVDINQISNNNNNNNNNSNKPWRTNRKSVAQPQPVTYQKKTEPFIIAELTKNETTMGECPICVLPDRKLTTFKHQCGNVCCVDCLKMYVRSCNNVHEIACIFHCGAKLQHFVDIRCHLTSDEYYDIFLKAFSRFCAHCDTEVRLIGAYQTKLECKHCGQSSCVNCNIPWPPNAEHNCITYQTSAQESVDEELAEYMQGNRESTRHCPGCNVAIEKNGGCSHMWHPACDTHFCWICLTAYFPGVGHICAVAQQ